jgi:hypothetical protein
VIALGDANDAAHADTPPEVAAVTAIYERTCVVLRYLFAPVSLRLTNTRMQQCGRDHRARSCFAKPEADARRERSCSLLGAGVRPGADEMVAQQQRPDSDEAGEQRGDENCEGGLHL